MPTEKKYWGCHTPHTPPPPTPAARYGPANAGIISMIKKVHDLGIETYIFMSLKGAIQTYILLGASINNIIKLKILSTEINSDRENNAKHLHDVMFDPIFVNSI